MATMNEVAARVDAVRPNIFTSEQKFRWINNLEGLIAREVTEDEAPEYAIPEDADTPLLVAAPFDDVYDFYVMAMIDLMNKEYDHYNNAVAVFKERYDQYKVWYIRNNPTCKARNFRRVMG